MACLNETFKTGVTTDPGKFVKLAQRVETAMQEHLCLKEPKQLDPQSVLVAPMNRDRAPPNLRHIHDVILKSFIIKGYDRQRPQTGICIEYLSVEGKKELIEHNLRFSKGCALLPAIDESKAMYGSLAGSHFNIALRLIKAGAISPAGDLRSLTQDNVSLADTVNNGHRWWILKENTPKETQVEISLWRNQDQNESQGIHEMEILQTIMAAANTMRYAKHDGKVSMADLVSKAARRNPAKISSVVLSTMAKFFGQFLENGYQHLIQELVDFHAMKVNPRELVVANNFFHTLVSEDALLHNPYTRHYLLLTHYTNEKVRAQASGASSSAFLESATLVALVKKPAALEAIETKIVECRAKYLELLVSITSPQQARLDFAEYMILLIRCLLAKPWPLEHLSRFSKISTGKFTNEKATEIGVLWAKLIDEKYPNAQFAIAAGLLATEGNAVLEDSQEIDLNDFSLLKKRPSDETSNTNTNSPYQFKRGTW